MSDISSAWKEQYTPFSQQLPELLLRQSRLLDDLFHRTTPEIARMYRHTGDFPLVATLQNLRASRLAPFPEASALGASLIIQE